MEKPKNSGVKSEKQPVWFLSRSQQHRPIFIQRQIFEKSWEYIKDVFTCFVDLDKAFDWVPLDKLWRVLQEYGIGGHLLMAIEYSTKSFHVGASHRQGCVLSPLLFIIYMNWMDKLNQTDK